MNAPKNKFDWVYALVADSRLSDGHRLIGAVIALKYVLTNGDMTFHVRQATVAASCGTSERSVRRAYYELRSHGYIELLEGRERGLRGKSDAYRLTLGVQDSTVLYPKEEVQDRTDRSTGQDCPKYRTELTEVQDRTNAGTSENDPPKGFNKGLDKGLERGADAAASRSLLISDEEEILEGELVDDDPDPEPPEHCTDHMPYGTGDSCGGCKIARKNHERWQGRSSTRLLASLFKHCGDTSDTPTVATPDCRYCDEKGWLLGTDGTVIDPAIACTHSTDSSEGRTW